MISPRNALAALALSASLAFTHTALAQPAHTEPAPTAERLAEIEAQVAASDAMRRFGSAEAPAKAPGTARFATYNIENLFDDVDDPSLSDKEEDAGQTKELHERVAVARAIRTINADVLCLQEVESLDAVLWFRDQFLADMGYEHVVSLEAGGERGIENAVLSRYPLADPQVWPAMPLGGTHPAKYGNGENWYAGQPIAFRRSPLKVDVQLPEGPVVTLFVVHHKSGGPAAYWREAESKGVLGLIAEITKSHPGRGVMVMGDFNAETRDQSVKTYLEGGFHDIFAKHEQTEAITSHESGRRIDLILANEAAKSHLLADQAFVFGTAARPAGINYRDLDTFEGLASDHYPVVVDFRLTETPQPKAQGG